jgi:hypothetical protein
MDKASILLNWVFYMVFAFSRWPVSGTGHARDPDVPRPPESTRSIPNPVSSSPTPAAAMPSARVITGSAAGPGAGPGGAPRSPAPQRPGAQSCGWCGESLPGNRALFHDCGSKDRPETFCKNCGSALPAGSATCSSCDAA